MKPSNLQSLKYFVGKVCTIFVPSSNLPFDEATARQHFTIRVQDVDAEGLWGTNLTTKTVVFLRWQYIMSIQEELELDPKNPEHAALIEQYSQQNEQETKCACQSNAPIETPSSEGDSTFVDIQSLTKLARQTRNSYDAV